MSGPTWINAARTRIREDRLTELLAATLAVHDRFAGKILGLAGLPAGISFEVSTQIRLPSGRRPDMQVLAVGPGGEVLSRLWSEHKTGSTYSANQLEDYAEALDRFPSPKKLLAVSGRLDDTPRDDRWCRATWGQVARLAAEAGAEHERSAGLGWRASARLPQASASQMLLDELLSYLEEEHGAVVDPISHLDVIAFARSNRASEAISDVMGRSAELCNLDPQGDPGWYKDDWGTLWLHFSAPSAWAAAHGGWPELYASEADDWAYPRVGEPALGFGFTLPKALYDELSQSPTRAWREAIQAAGFTVWVDDSHTRVYRTMYLSELMAKGATADAQATAVAEWIDESFAALASHDPNLTSAG